MTKVFFRVRLFKVHFKRRTASIGKRKKRGADNFVFVIVLKVLQEALTFPPLHSFYKLSCAFNILCTDVRFLLMSQCLKSITSVSWCHASHVSAMICLTLVALQLPSSDHRSAPECLPRGSPHISSTGLRRHVMKLILLMPIIIRVQAMSEIGDKWDEQTWQSKWLNVLGNPCKPKKNIFFWKISRGGGFAYETFV